MKSPLERYKEVTEQFNVNSDGKRLPVRNILAYVSEQANQQRAIANRLVCDAAKASIDMELAKDETTKSAYEKQFNEYRDDLRQMSKALDFFVELERELREENPDTISTPADHPDGF